MVIMRGESDLAYVGLLLLIVFGVMIWNDRPIQSPRPYDTPYTQPLDRNVSDYSLSVICGKIRLSLILGC